MSRSSTFVGVVLGSLWGCTGGGVGGSPGTGTGGASLGGGSGGGAVATGGGSGGNAAGTGGSSGGGGTGGSATGGSATGGSASGGSASGGSATGGSASGGSGTGGSPATGGGGGRAAGGAPADGGVDAGGGRGTGGSSGGGRDGGTGTDADAAPGTLPYKGVANSSCAELTSLKASWFYNWTQTASACAGVEFVPMIWGHTGAEQTAAGITTAISAIVGRGGKTVLGFNEPDTATQSNIPVATAISLWPSFNNPAVRLGSPGTSANAAGVAWFNSFMSMVNADTTGRLRVDFLAVHWYGWNAGSCEPTAASLENYIRQIEAIPGNRPIWITEWGCLNQSNPNAQTVQAFFSGAIAMFARHPRIERYAWYPWTANNELFMGGTLTALGTVFANAPSFK